MTMDFLKVPSHHHKKHHSHSHHRKKRPSNRLQAVQVTDELYLTYVQRQKFLGNIVRRQNELPVVPDECEDDDANLDNTREDIIPDLSTASYFVLVYFTVKLGWREIWKLIVIIACWLWKSICLLKYLNPMHYFF